MKKEKIGKNMYRHKHNKLRIALTGATGLLGRNLLFEIIKQNLNNLDNLEIFVLGRGKNDLDIQQRIQQIIFADGLSYLSSGKKSIENVKNCCKNAIKYFHADLDKEKLDLEPEDFKELRFAPIDVFFHIASLTDFRDTPSVREALKNTNVYGTQRILQLITSLKIDEFQYVGSAYSSDAAAGNIKPDYVNFNHNFRNFYEITKLEAEVLVRKFSKKTDTRCKYLRPSTMCGRLIEPELGAISKFDVFYSWAAFFLHTKLKEMKSNKNIYTEPININIRLCYSLKSGLNIIPADYAAKVMYQIWAQNDPNESFYLVNDQEIPHRVYIPIMLKTLNINGAKQVEDIPKQMNYLENLYYKTVGRSFTPYITAEPMLFDTQSLKSVLHRANLSCPPINEKNFDILMNYAKKHNFGIRSGDVS